MQMPLIRIAVVASISLLWVGSAARAEITPPKEGMIADFECSGPYGKQNTFKIVSVKNNKVRIERMQDGKATWTERPITAAGLNLYWKLQQNIGRGIRKQSLDEEILNKYARLVPGTMLEFNVRERDDETKWEWGYKIGIGEPQTIVHEVIGEITVFPVTEKRKVWGGSYTSEMTTFVAPEKGFGIAWTYRDRKGTVDCKLVGMY